MRRDLLDCCCVTCLGTKVVEQLCSSLLAVVGLPEGIDYPDLAEMNRGRQSGRFRVIGDELDVLNSTALDDVQSSIRILILNPDSSCDKGGGVGSWKSSSHLEW